MKKNKANAHLAAGQKTFFPAKHLPAIFLILIFLSLSAYTLFLAPDRVLLLPEKGAEWIRYPQPSRPLTYKPARLENLFRYRFRVDKVPPEAMLKLRAMKSVSVYIDDRRIYLSDPATADWKGLHTVDILAFLTPGFHDLVLRVQNQNGFPAVMAYCQTLQIVTGQHWQAGVKGESWRPAMLSKEMPSPDLSHRFARADKIFTRHLWLYVPIFFSVFALSGLSGYRNRFQLLINSTLTPQTVRRLLLLMWLVLAANNIGKLPLDVGFDIDGHLEYVRYVAEKGRIPFAAEGWEMFNSPFFYIIAALLFKSAAFFFSADAAIHLLRIIPLFCGAAQVEISYRLASAAYPHRNDLQILGMLIGGLLPMNVYISQVSGNEPLTGLLCGIVVLLTFKWLRKAPGDENIRIWLIGLFAGLAVLTKVSAVLLIPVVIVFVGYRTVIGGGSLQRPLRLSIQRMSIVFGVAAAVAGWYYLRNFIVMGRFFALGGWDVAGQIVWWQEPGFRTLAQLASFGQALYYPIYSGLSSMWDSIYSSLWLDGFLSGKILYRSRPPWNYHFMLASAWLSLPLTLALIAGIFKTLVKPAGPEQLASLFLAACFLAYGAAFFYLYLTLPVYSVGKATYLLGIAPCMMIFCVKGFEILSRSTLFRAAVHGIVACWAVASYLAYFIL